jgi:hypothetical protein
MKKIGIAFLWCALCATPSASSQTTATWDIVKDVQISFSQGANGVWYFMESESRVQDPSAYRLLRRYLAPCKSSATRDVVPGVGCWQGTEAHPPGCCALKTEVAFNFRDKLLDSQDLFPGYLPHSLLMTATWERFAIVAWQSPITGVVKVAGAFGWRNTFQATEVNWFLDKGKETLKSGLLFGGQVEGSLSLPEVAVTKGDVLYLIVDDFNFEECFCANAVDFHARITQLR